MPRKAAQTSRLSAARQTCLALFFSGRFHLRMDAAFVWFLDQPPKSSSVYFPCISISPYALMPKTSVPVFRDALPVSDIFTLKPQDCKRNTAVSCTNIHGGICAFYPYRMMRPRVS